MTFYFCILRRCEACKSLRTWRKELIGGSVILCSDDLAFFRALCVRRLVSVCTRLCCWSVSLYRRINTRILHLD